MCKILKIILIALLLSGQGYCAIGLHSCLDDWQLESGSDNDRFKAARSTVPCRWMIISSTSVSVRESTASSGLGKFPGYTIDAIPRHSTQVSGHCRRSNSIRLAGLELKDTCIYLQILCLLI